MITTHKFSAMKNFTFLILLVTTLTFSGWTQNERNVLVYNLTDTDCGPCSCMDSIIHNCLLPAYPRTVIVALHSPMMNSHFRDYQGNDLFVTFHALYEPSGFIDGLGFDTPYQAVTDSVGQQYARNSQAPVSITIDSKTWDPVTRNVTMNLTMKNLGASITRGVWMNIFITEDHLIASHRIRTGCATPSPPGNLPFKYDFVNDHVIRRVEYFSHGDSLIGPVWPSQQTVTRQCVIHIDTAWNESNTNMSVAVYIHNDSLYKSPILQAISQNVKGATGTEEMGIKESGIVKVFPNPADDWVNVHMNVAKPGLYLLELLDINGKSVDRLFNGDLVPGNYNAEFRTREWTAGQYFIRFSTEGESWIKPLIVR